MHVSKLEIKEEKNRLERDLWSNTLISRNCRDIFSSRRDAQDLIAIDRPVYFSQVPKGTGDSSREIGNISHLHQQLNKDTAEEKYLSLAAISTAVFSIKLHQVHSRWPEHKAMAQTVSQLLASDAGEQAL